VYFLNPIIDGNYFYLKYRPFFKEWPESIYIPFVVIGTLIGFYTGFKIYTKLLPMEEYEIYDYKGENI
jgi:hypothetical protein